MASATVFLTELPAATRRVALDLWRRRRPAAAFGEIMDDRHVRVLDPVKPAEQAITALDVRAALARLSPEHRAVITEMYLNRHTAMETADLLGVSLNTVNFRSYYALHALREALAGSARGPWAARV
jgi:RNA polymerase sigma-70 factor (ECF subfamily)